MRKPVDAPPHGYGGGHRAVVDGQAGAPPVASSVCRTLFHDPHVGEGPVKSADILFTVPVGFPFWGASQFEPLIVAIIFPLSHASCYPGPWTVKGTDQGEHTGGIQATLGRVLPDGSSPKLDWYPPGPPPA
jgi:hypothetical protein